MKIIDESFQNLNHMLDKVSDQMRETQWYRLLHGPAATGLDAESDFAMRYSQYYAVVVLFNQSMNQRWLEDGLCRLLEKHYELAVVPLANNTSAIIVNTDADEAEAAEHVQNALKHLAAREKFTFWAGMGEAQDTPCTLSISYREAVEALSCKALYRDGMFLLYSCLRSWPDYTGAVPVKELSEAISRGDAERALAIFDGFVETLLGSGAHWNIHSIESAISRCYYGLKEISNRLQLYASSDEPEQFSLELKQNMSGLIKWMRQTVESMARTEQEESAGTQNVVLERIRAYIGEHLDQDLSLPELARIGGQNVSYVSTQFKKAYGIGIVQYINQKRLEKACELLRATAMNVDEVARSVGFQNTSYFIKRFSQAYHMTPKNYKLQNLE